MNDLEKRSFYSFVALYLSSSFLFVLLSGYWYYSAQKNSLNSTVYYKLGHIADSVSAQIITAQMHNQILTLPIIEKGYEYYLVDPKEAKKYTNSYYEKDGFKFLVSSSPQGHLNVKYVVVKTREYALKLHELQKKVFLFMGSVFILIGIISSILAKLFMRPMHKRMKQIENFIQDVTHELNTPITALSMSSSRAIKKGVFDKKILTNISISTKQLQSIYKSLAYLNFNKEDESLETIDLQNVLMQVVRYYKELSEAKEIAIETKIESFLFTIKDVKAELLFSNLLSNAIKYSMPESTITISLEKNYFSIKDEGVGIAQEKLEEIFELYKRDSSIAGGFGIGLNIVKQICDEYNIRVEVSSELEVGSEFKLYFPVTKNF